LLLPAGFKETIASIFYDKEVAIFDKVSSKDAEGGVVIGKGVQRGTFKGNVRFTDLKKTQEDYGLDYKIDVAITTDYEDIYIGDLLGYKLVTYEVTDTLLYDSHILVVGVKYGKSGD